MSTWRERTTEQWRSPLLATSVEAEVATVMAGQKIVEVTALKSRAVVMTKEVVECIQAAVWEATRARTRTRTRIRISTMQTTTMGITPMGTTAATSTTTTTIQTTAKEMATSIMKARARMESLKTMATVMVVVVVMLGVVRKATSMVDTMLAAVSTITQVMNPTTADRCTSSNCRESSASGGKWNVEADVTTTSRGLVLVSTSATTAPTNACGRMQSCLAGIAP
mmetsp:Transcript_11989/g.26118  ORF Transcript_11989/g.26118 Transcript_11989/m.26118 type:complete len:224 (+) Transcript_11989:840-1511(+)